MKGKIWFVKASVLFKVLAFTPIFCDDFSQIDQHGGDNLLNLARLDAQAAPLKPDQIDFSVIDSIALGDLLSTIELQAMTEPSSISAEEALMNPALGGESLNPPAAGQSLSGTSSSPTYDTGSGVAASSFESSGGGTPGLGAGGIAGSVLGGLSGLGMLGAGIAGLSSTGGVSVIPSRTHYASEAGISGHPRAHDGNSEADFGSARNRGIETGSSRIRSRR